MAFDAPTFVTLITVVVAALFLALIAHYRECRELRARLRLLRFTSAFFLVTLSMALFNLLAPHKHTLLDLALFVIAMLESALLCLIVYYLWVE